MTKSQLKKLYVILGKLETLQNEVAAGDDKHGVADRLGLAKSELLRAMNDARST